MRNPVAGLAAVMLIAACNADRDDTVPGQAEAERPASGGVFDVPYLKRDLDNGLRVIIVPTDYPDIVSMHIPVQTGSRNETETGKTGFAHFFEHMMFRGTENYPAATYLDILRKAGATQNASTYDDYTNYYVDFTRADLEKIIEIEADRFMNLSYAEEIFRTEALAVRGEYLKNHSNPVNKAYERLRQLAYDEHSYGHATMGFIEDIERMPERYAYSRTFFDRWYRPEKTTIILAGDLDAEATFALVEKYWGPWQRGGYTADIPVEGPPDGPRFDHVVWEEDTQPWLLTAFRGPEFEPASPDMPAIDVIASLLFSNSSDLYRRLVIDEQWSDQLLTFFPNRRDPPMLLIYTRLTEARHAAAVETAIRETLAKARSELVSTTTLAETRSRLKYAFTGNLDNSRAIAEMLARYVHFERDPETVNTLYRSYDALTPETVRDVANRYFTDQRRVTVTLSNAATLGGINGTASIDDLVEPGEAAAAANAAVTAAPGALEQAAAMTAETAATAGGTAQPLQIVARPSATSALVDVVFLVHAGAAMDPPGKKGLAALTAAMIAGGGSEALGIEEINAAMYPLAAGFEAQVDKEMTRLSGQVHRDNLERWFRLVSGQLLTPAFDEEDFRRLRTQLVNGVRTSLVANNDEELAKELLYAEIFGPGHPYGAPNLGESEDLAALALEDLRKFYRRHYTLNNLTVGLAGGYPEAFEARLGSDLQRLPAGERNSLGVPPPPASSSNRALIVQKETPAVAVSLGFPIDLVRGDPDWVALWLVRSWLGEHRSSSARLFKMLREARGMNYGDYAYVEYFPRGMSQMRPDTNLARQQQIFQVWLRPLRSNNGAHFAVRAVIHELGRLIEQGMTKQDFEATRSFLAKNVSLLTDGQSRQLGYALDARYYGIDDFSNYVRDGLARLSLADVNRVIREQLDTDNLQYVFVSRDAAALRERLLADRPSPLVYDADKPDELLAEDRRIQALPVPFADDDVRIVEAGALFR